MGDEPEASFVTIKQAIQMKKRKCQSLRPAQVSSAAWMAVIKYNPSNKTLRNKSTLGR